MLTPVAYKTFPQSLTGDPPVRVPLFTGEQCARVCEALDPYVYDEATMRACAAAIRAQSTPQPADVRADQPLSES